MSKVYISNKVVFKMKQFCHSRYHQQRSLRDTGLLMCIVPTKSPKNFKEAMKHPDSVVWQT